MYRPESTIRAHVLTSQGLICGTDPSSFQSKHPTTDNNVQVVYMAGINFSRTSHDDTTPEEARKVGTDDSGSEVQDASTKPHVATHLHRKIRTNSVVEVLEPKWTFSESNLLECAVYTQQTVISCNLLQLVSLLATCFGLTGP